MSSCQLLSTKPRFCCTRPGPRWPTPCQPGALPSLNNYPRMLFGCHSSSTFLGQILGSVVLFLYDLWPQGQELVPVLPSCPVDCLLPLAQCLHKRPGAFSAIDHGDPSPKDWYPPPLSLSSGHTEEPVITSSVCASLGVLRHPVLSQGQCSSHSSHLSSADHSTEGTMHFSKPYLSTHKHLKLFSRIYSLVIL